MFSGARGNARMRLPVFLLIALLFSFYGLAQQKAKTKPKPGETTTVAGDPATGAPVVTDQTSTPATAVAQEETAAQVPAEKTVAATPPKGTRTKSANSAAKTESPGLLPATAQQIRDTEAALAAAQATNALQIPIVPPSDPPAQVSSTTAAAAPQESPAPAPTSAWLDMVKTAGSIGLVLCLILGGYMMFRRFAPQYVAKRPNERSLRMIESISMGDKRSIAIVQAGNMKFLVASTPGQITLLTSLSETATVPAVAEPTETEAASGAKFRNLYEMEKKAVPSRPAARADLPPDIRGKMQQLRKALEG
jgi:flagellar biogenesis protein FliO